MLQPSILVLDQEDDQLVGTQLKRILQREPVWRVESVRTWANALTNPVPNLVIAVLPESKKKAERLVGELTATTARPPILVVAKSDFLPVLSDDTLLCADDFIRSPLEEAEALLRVRKFLHQRAHRPLHERVSEACGLAQLVGEDPAFCELKRKIPLVAQFESTVLLVGETGTGKERCARALHYLSRRADNSFLPVNCGAIPNELFESELYGHEKGSFTGASRSHAGFIAAAEGGTLFLDEIENLSLAGQGKLLRFLQDQTYYAVGSAKHRQANVWIIASSNMDLPGKIREGTFREDLFYRLAVITLALPPLRQRRSDIPRLAAHFWKLYETRGARVHQRLSPGAIEALCRYSWPGNVRELENTIQQIIALTESETVQPQDLPVQLRASSGPRDNSFKEGKALAIDEFEKAYITELLRTHEGNVTRAADAAGKDRRAFGRLIKKHRIPRS